ncbi:MAG: MBL fold metallo-hydrolase, partial [Lachnospiraceae bacterium]|nr:MBL fold metallo-hydrolase [Lachnospiraceae bacterium]
MFLIEGEKRALLVDAGIGIGDLKTFAQELVQKPLDVFLTHNHRDHVGNAALFPRVYMSEVDMGMGPVVRPLTSAASRLDYTKHILKRYPDRDYPWTKEDVKDFSVEEEPEVIPLKDGDSFDLGGRTVSCYLCPGHTPGSMVAIDSRTKYLFAGDACNYFQGIGVRPIQGMRHASIEEAHEALLRIWNMDFDREHIYNAHADYRQWGSPLPSQVFEKLIEAMSLILAGNYVGSRQWIQMIDTDVDTAVLDDVTIQFHSDNIYRKQGA